MMKYLNKNRWQMGVHIEDILKISFNLKKLKICIFLNIPKTILLISTKYTSEAILYGEQTGYLLSLHIKTIAAAFQRASILKKSRDISAYLGLYTECPKKMRMGFRVISLEQKKSESS